MKVGDAEINVAIEGATATKAFFKPKKYNKEISSVVCKEVALIYYSTSIVLDNLKL